MNKKYKLYNNYLKDLKIIPQINLNIKLNKALKILKKIRQENFIIQNNNLSKINKKNIYSLITNPGVYLVKNPHLR